MKKANLKRYSFKISIVAILIVSLFLCIYSVKNYKSSNVSNSSQFGRMHDMSNNKNGRMNQPPNMPSPNSSSGNAQNENGGFQPNNMQNGNNGMQHGMEGGVVQRGNADTTYLPALTVYSVVFLIMCCVIYYFYKQKKIKINLSNEKVIIFTLLSVGFLLRITVSTLMGGHNDINLFKNWAESAAKSLTQFYSSAMQADYPPLYIYVLGLIGKIATIDGLSSYFVLLLKVPSIIAEVITAYFIYKLSKKRFSVEVSILLATFYIFNPAIFFVSTFWGQVDSFFTLLLVVAVYLLSEKKYVFSSAMFAACVLMKPQGIIFLPILFYELVGQRKIKNFIYAAISALITVVVIILPFSFGQQSPLWILNLYSKTISEYPFASVNGFNFFALIGANGVKNTTTLFIFNYHTWGMIFIVAVSLFSWVIYAKGKNRAFVPAIALFQIAGVFTFSSGMHERYLFSAVALSMLAFIYLKDRRFLILALGFTITNYLNISSVFFNIGDTAFTMALQLTSLMNIILVGYLGKVLFDNAVAKKDNSGEKVTDEKNQAI
ncbi:glycosyltransferase family 39 protein [Inconstantimicrobium mannanitabidum]|uniref:Uncharacterized protein n=1 Tax=Inconstantimicrobium mannanitabidum TaxID=1604901 RepID=A0ACB5RDP8_9CLOT|nr:glycosyltransferase family 39 protein [Clostridium sp. TW13]GKX67395.1 hypothetical protein rsdtw13_26530 [Clostridium sp. TW13]